MASVVVVLLVLDIVKVVEWLKTVAALLMKHPCAHMAFSFYCIMHNLTFCVDVCTPMNSYVFVVFKLLYYRGL